VKLVPTGRHVEIARSGGESRELGRDIVQTTGGHSHDGSDSHHDANLSSIPIKVVST
jgi:hypothetical protein